MSPDRAKDLLPRASGLRQIVYFRLLPFSVKLALKEIREGLAVHICEDGQFNCIYPAFPAFAFGEEGLSDAQAPRGFDLS